MSDNIEKYKLVARVATELYKARGDVAAVADVTGLDPDYVRRLAAKLKKRMRHDVAYQTAIVIMESIWTGYYQRTHHLNDCLTMLRGKEEIVSSMCCDYPVQVKDEGGTDVTRCGKCVKVCFTHMMTKSKIINLQTMIIRELREEDKLLIEFAEKMGFTAKVDLPPNVYKQNILFMGGEDRSKKSIKSDVKEATVDGGVLRAIEEDLTPMERHKLSKKIDDEIAKVRALPVKGGDDVN